MKKRWCKLTCFNMEMGKTSSISFKEGKISLRYDEGARVLIKEYSDKISIKDLVSSWDEIFREFPFPEDMKGIVLDYSNAFLDFPASHHDRIVNFYLKHLDFFKNYGIGVVANNPHNIVVAMLVARADSRYCLRPFTTLKAAILWVQNGS